MKTIAAVTICVLSILLPSQLFGQNNDKSLLIIRIYESPDKGYNKIIVTENDKKIEQIDLIPFYYKDLESNQIEINKILVKYRKAGYLLISSICGNSSPAVGSATLVMVTSYLFEK